MVGWPFSVKHWVGEGFQGCLPNLLASSGRLHPLAVATFRVAIELAASLHAHAGGQACAPALLKAFKSGAMAF